MPLEPDFDMAFAALAQSSKEDNRKWQEALCNCDPSVGFECEYCAIFHCLKDAEAAINDLETWKMERLETE